MGAREKLNSTHILGALLFAGVIGLMTQSGFVFLVTLAIVIGAGLHDGGIRPSAGARR